MMVFWIINFLAGTVVVILFPHIWVAIGVYYVFALSIYANWDTDYDAVGASQANKHSQYLVKEHDKEAVKVTVEKLPEVK